MHLELVELLRCPNAHAPSVLVAAADEIENRYVLNGLLGCPECLAEYAVRAGVTYFTGHVDENASANLVTASVVDRDVAMRLAAQLGLSAGRTVFALIGFNLDMAIAMREIVAARVLLINPPQHFYTEQSLPAVSQAAPFGIALCGETMPLVARKLDGIAVAHSRVSEKLLDQCVQLLRPNARLVAPTDAPVPSGMRELVRDEQVWVAEREAIVSAPIPLTRR
ncbi:MAG: hypothetical protein ABI120_20380 [Gemmatimonadaceae bacterium]